MSVQDWLRRDELQQFETPDSAPLDDLRILPVEVARIRGRGKLTVEVELFVDERERLVERQKLRKPEEKYFDIGHLSLMWLSSPFPSGDGVGLLRTVDRKGRTGYFVDSVAFVSFSLGNLENPDPRNATLEVMDPDLEVTKKIFTFRR